MGVSNATLELLVTMKDNASSGLSSLTGALGTLGTAGLAVAAAGVAALGVAIAGGVSDAMEARGLFASTEQTILTMGNAAGRSAQEVADLASSLSDASGKSLFGDDQIHQAENLLLTFGNIKGETFDLATALTVDLATALGGAPADQAMMLGKALNDPIKGITALGKAGLTFSEEQKAAIAAMVETGNMAGAQALIIKELNSQVGGQAAAAATAAGGMVQFKAALGETFETIGSKLLPILDQLGAWLNSPDVQTAISTFAENLGNGITIAAEWISGTLIPALAEVWAYIQANVIPILSEIVTWLATNVPPAMAATADFITGTLIPAFQAVWAYIQDNVIPIIAEIVVWLAENVPPAMAAVSDFITGTLIPAFQAVWAFIQTNVIPILSTVVTWFKANLPPAMAAVSTFITGTLVPAFQMVWAFIQDKVIPILTAVANVASALVMVQVRALAALWTGVLQPALNTVWSFIQDNVVPIFGTLASFITGTLNPAISGMAGVLSPVAGWFGDIGSAISGVVDWLTKLADTINSVEIPDWAKGQSPPPLADWFSYIADAAKDATAAIDTIALPPVTLPALAQTPALGGGIAATDTASGTIMGAGGTVVRIVFDAGEMKKLITATIEQVLSDSGQRAFNRQRVG